MAFSWVAQAHGDCDVKAVDGGQLLVCEKIEVFQKTSQDAQKVTLTMADGFVVNLTQSEVADGPDKIFTHVLGDRDSAVLDVNDRLAIQKALLWVNDNDMANEFSGLKSFELLPTDAELAPISLFAGEVPWPEKSNK